MDEQVRNFLAVVNNANQPPIDQVPIEETRKQFDSLGPIFHPHVEIGRIVDLKADSGVPIRGYYPDSACEELPPAIVYFHGGGWVMGNIETHDTLCRHLANHSSCAVFSVDYRLAPEHPFPAARDDSYEATQFILDRATELGVDAGRIAVAGDSAGGNLALVVALMARAKGSFAIAAQCLLYPVLDRRCETESYFDFAEDYGLTKTKMQFFWNAYVADDDRNNPDASPTFAEDLSDLPPTLMLTAEYDVLHDEGLELAQRLRTAGNKLDYRCCEGMMHGFIHFAGAIERGQTELAVIGRELGRTLRRGA